MKTPHKHAEMIKAWADGETLQYYDKHSCKWLDYVPASFSSPSDEFRVKPKPKPDVVRYIAPTVNHGSWEEFDRASIRVTFDGETGKLKSAEVLS